LSGKKKRGRVVFRHDDNPGSEATRRYLRQSFVYKKRGAGPGQARAHNAFMALYFMAADPWRTGAVRVQRAQSRWRLHLRKGCCNADKVAIASDYPQFDRRKKSPL